MAEYQHKIHLEYHIHIGGGSRDPSGTGANVDCLGKLVAALSSLESAFKSIDDELSCIGMSQQNNELHFNVETDDNKNLYFKLYQLFSAHIPTKINQKKSNPESLTICETVLNEFKKTMYDRNTGMPRTPDSDISLEEIRNLANVIDIGYSDGDVRDIIQK